MENAGKKISIPLIIGGLVLVVVIGAAGVSVFLSNNKNDESQTGTNNIDMEELNNSTETIVEDGSSNQDTATTDSSEQYQDGTYTATGTYTSPAGEEEIEVSLTLQDDTILDVVVTSDPSNATTQNYQSKFKEGIAGVVVGQKIDEVAFDGNVNGSSLTPKGFLDALETIKTEAQS